MTAPAITPLLVPPSPSPTVPRPQSLRRPLPVAFVPAARPSDAAVYGMAAMDDRGRVTDRSLFRAL